MQKLPALGLVLGATNSFFRSLRPSESRGQSQEKEPGAQFAVFARDLKSLAAAARLLGAAAGTGTFSILNEVCCTCCLLLLFRRERRRDGALPLAVEKRGILFVDVPLFLRGRVRARDIENSGSA